jgi:hypothetical protein
MTRRARLTAVALLALTPLATVGSDARALTAWRTFGQATATGLGPIGAGVVDPSSVFVDSITGENPARIRLVINGPQAGRASIRWHMVCGNSATDAAETKVISFNARLPRIVVLSDKLGGVRNWRFCGVDAQVTYRRVGTIRLLLQARY